ncbi:type 1 glutamine amidotransferase domain-containing protein [Pasteurellaceae bacterium LIM206]|nr:type 1 glutamine amidotransferase domain-containing protein [Pasteurellaceae bacterium LIM206]
MSVLKVLMIVTSQATMPISEGGNGQPTGIWYEELATPYYVLQDAGVQVDIASIKGGAVPIDPRSLRAKDRNPASVNRFESDPAALQKLKTSMKLDDVHVAGYSAVFLPGGHGPMWDEANSKTLAEVISTAWQNGQVVGAVCHGGAGLINAKDSNGEPLVKDRRVSAFSNAEEGDGKVPFHLETRLRELGAKYESGANFQPFAIQDGKLITGQNPASSEQVAKMILAEIKNNK